MSDFFDFICFIVCLLGMVVIPFIAIVTFVNQADCHNIGKIYNKNVEFYIASGCYIHDNGDILPKGAFLKSKLVTDKGLSLNHRYGE